MTSGDDDTDREEQELEALLPQAMSGELIPTSVADVARAEAEGVEFDGELPESLRAFEPDSASDAVEAGDIAEAEGDSDPEASEGEELDDSDDEEDERALGPDSRADVVPLARARRRQVSPWLTHVAAAALGAAAVATLVIGRGEKPAAPAGSSSHAPEPPPVADAAPDAPQLVQVPPPAACGMGCCAGKECKTASPELADCASGRRCIPCTLKDRGTTRYRVKMGALAPLNAGRTVLDRAGPGAVDVCARAGGSPEVCVPAHASSSADAPWSSLPLVVSAQDLLAALTIRVRVRGVKAPIAEWQSPVPVSPTVLCRGLSVKPKNKKDEAFGAVSLFLDDAHFVEAARSAQVAALSQVADRIRAEHLKSKIFQTRRGGDQRFALVYGPMPQGDAEKLRWVLLEGGLKARVTLGDDHEGDPKP